MRLSIVTTLYQSSAYINEFYNRVKSSAKMITEDIEIIFVNDGSPDNSYEITKQLCEKDTAVKMVNFSKNFGHHKALMTGLKHATGDYIFLIDSDLEEDPELLILFFNELKENKDLDVVYGVQEKRKGSFFEKITGYLFFKFLNYFSDIKITANLCVVRLMTRRYVNALLGFTEQEFAFVGLAALTGFKQKAITIKKHCLTPSTYTLKKKLAMSVDFITSLSKKPLVYIFNLGIFITLFAFACLVFILARKLFFQDPLEGWTSIMISIWLFGGIIIFCLGIIGLYLSKIFIEVKKRPYTIIENIYSKDNPHKAPQE